MATNNPAKNAKAKAVAAQANNAESAKQAEEDPTRAAAQSDSGATGTYGAEGVEDTSKKKTNGDTYVVQDGDTLEKVANEAGMEPVELVALNPEIATGSGSNFLYTGQEIRLK